MPTSPESATKFPKRNLLLMVAFILAVLICSFLLATWFTSGWRNPDLGPENLTPQGKPASAGAFSATGSAGSGGETSRRAVQSHLQILVQQDDGKITEIERLEGGKLPASPTLFADIKLDRADNASLYLISIDTMGQVSLINEKPLDLAPNGSQKTHDPEYLPEAEHFLIQGETADFHRIPHSGPEGMLTCVLLSRKTPASDEIIEQWKTRFDSLKSTPLPAPSAAAKGRFTVRDGELRPRTTPDPLGKDHPLRGLLDEVLNPLHEAADAIEVVTFAVPAHSSEEMP